ncbi:hypothetical protein [Teredinibacter purpureus]|uniref:hypothetical protein n=1 Tax=Teredinibacter purpureus TaxID=2731756 RepID=UPI0013C44193|nr:hypothetical protein [Teredinibacter purpureus]
MKTPAKRLLFAAPLKLALALLLATLFVGSQLAHAEHFHLEQDNTTSQECSVCSLSAVVPVPSLVLLLTFACGVLTLSSLYRFYLTSVDVSSNGSRAPPIQP